MARPRKTRDPKDLDDDAPVFIDEHSQDVVSKEAYEAMISKPEPGVSERVDPSKQAETKDDVQKGSDNEATSENSNSKKITATIGGSRKRRLAKVVGDDEEATQTPIQQDARETSNKPKLATKSKKIKLSFDEME